jgi:hypothetical protein
VTERPPYIDEHTLIVRADRDRTWIALERMLQSVAPAFFTRMLGATDTRHSGPRPLAVGSTLPGFHVLTAQRPTRLTLAGRHKYSEYELTFHLADAGSGTTQLRAESRARFPGLLGALYRFGLMRFGMHARATRAMLQKVRRIAESAPH